MREKKRRIFFGMALLTALFTMCLGIMDAEAAAPPRMVASISSPANATTVASPVDFTATVANGTPPFTFRWTFSRGNPASFQTTNVSVPTSTTVHVTYARPGRYLASVLVTDSAPRRRLARAIVRFTIAGAPVNAPKSINSTGAKRPTIPAQAVVETPFATRNDFQIVSANDLGMHCGDLDHRVASILPPFNVVHAQVIQRGTANTNPLILDNLEADVFYSAASNPKDPALANPLPTSIFKTNFWDLNPLAPHNPLWFDAYDPFYPPGVLTPAPSPSSFTLTTDVGLPVPDLEVLFPGAPGVTGPLQADQQDMPGISNPYVADVQQPFKRFDTDFPLFINFPFGYRQTQVNWFAADGISIAPFDDSGRKNSYPLMRIQAKAKTAALTGTAGTVLASLDTVLPVSAEADCYRCHTSSADGGNGRAACIPTVDANCQIQGSPRSTTSFAVALASQDTANVPPEAKREWAADNNILRLHDAKHGTSLQNANPVVCQRCHYTPALDLAHFGPLGPGDPAANGRDQKVHRTNSRVMHAFHAQFTDLFQNDMPPSNSPLRTVAGKPVINAFVLGKLNESCYQCHPGRDTKCLRGAMFNGGLVCQDCHGNMQQVGNDFSQNFSVATPFPAPGSADLTKRVPWANEPGCQSCHTGDALNNLTTDPNVIHSPDGIRLLQAYRTNDINAKPIVAVNRRFAENVNGGNQVLYRLSKDSHGGVFCQGCHGSTHAEWPVQTNTATTVANDNMAALQLQGHTGKITECTVCHAAGSLPVSLGGPHGMHPVNDQNFVGGHPDLFAQSRASCQACHGATGQGTVLAKVAANRTLAVEGRTVTLRQDQLVSCNLCHENPL